jgi:hypothetical protein
MDMWPLTLTQQDIYFDQLRHANSPLYNVGGYIDMGRIDVQRLTEAHGRLVATHSAFGLRVHCDSRGLGQSLSDLRTVALEFEDFHGFADGQARARERVARLFETALEMEHSELFRVRLLRISADRFWYVGLAHHIAMDGWTFAIWARHLAAIYSGRDVADVPAEARWQLALDDERYVGSPEYHSDREYWQRHIGELPARLLDVRHGAGDGQGIGKRGGRHSVQLTADELASLRSVAARIGVGVAHPAIAAVGCYFSFAAASSRMLLGVSLHNRRNPTQKRMMSAFAGVRPVCFAVERHSSTVTDLIREIAAHQKLTLRHQRYPLGHIMRDFGVHLSGRTLHDVGFSYLRLEGGLELDAAPAELVYLSHNHRQTPLMITLWERAGSAELQFDYNGAYFDREEVGRLAASVRQLLVQMPMDLDKRICALQPHTVPATDAPRGDPRPAGPFSSTQESEIESRLAAICSNISGISVDRPGDPLHSRRTGEHPLSLATLANRVFDEWRVNLPMSRLAQSRTLRDLARLIDAELALRSMEERRAPPQPRGGGTP